MTYLSCNLTFHHIPSAGVLMLNVIKYFFLLIGMFISSREKLHHIYKHEKDIYIA